MTGAKYDLLLMTLLAPLARRSVLRLLTPPLGPCWFGATGVHPDGIWLGLPELAGPRRCRVCACGASQMTDAVCTFCKKTVGPQVEVREGEKLFHLDCYRLYKRGRARGRE